MNPKNLNVTTKIPKLLKDKLKNNKITTIYNRFEKSLNINENFLVAVSGGADSLALAFFAKIYSIKKGLTSKFFIVDHKLRHDSTSEAKKVRTILKKFSINANILTWHGKKPKSNIQSHARKKRYKLLIDESRKLKIKNILVGHNQNDLIENFFIRFLRGSGLRGLVSLDKKTFYEEVNILRPLLDYFKKDLEFVSQKVFNYYVNDPSNNDEKFLRIKVRKFINDLQKDGLDSKNFSKTIKNLKLSNNLVKLYTKKNLKENTSHLNRKKKFILNTAFFDQSHEVVLRSLSDIIKIVGEKHYSVRGKKLERVINKMQNNSFTKATLGHCLIEKISQTVIITKE